MKRFQLFEKQKKIMGFKSWFPQNALFSINSVEIMGHWEILTRTWKQWRDIWSRMEKLNLCQIQLFWTDCFIFQSEIKKSLSNKILPASNQKNSECFKNSLDFNSSPFTNDNFSSLEHISSSLLLHRSTIEISIERVILSWNLCRIISMVLCQRFRPFNFAS